MSWKDTSGVLLLSSPNIEITKVKKATTIPILRELKEGDILDVTLTPLAPKGFKQVYINILSRNNFVPEPISFNKLHKWIRFNVEWTYND